MITRTAIFEGEFVEGREEEFFAAIKQRLAPLWARFPGAMNVRWRRIALRDGDAPPIVMMQQIDYADMAALEAAIASPVRTEARAATMEIMEMLDGRFYHLVSDADQVEPGVPG